MNLQINKLVYFALGAMILFLSTAVVAQTRAYRVTDKQVQTLLTRIETRTDTFRRTVASAYQDQYRDNIKSFVNDFENSTDVLERNFEDGLSQGTDVQDVLNRAAAIDSFIRSNQTSTKIRNQWNLIRSDLNTLASYYRVNWAWNDQNYPNSQPTGFDSRLTGTYRLNVNQSDNVSATVERAISGINYNDTQRARTQQNLERRLTSPEMMMIEKRGQQVTLATSTSTQVSFSADGTTRSETSDNGRTVQTRVTATNSDLTINYEGDRINDYYVAFRPMSNGQLQVTRRVYLEARNETVTVRSVYDKTDQVARWNTNTYPSQTDTNGVFIVPNNVRITTKLDTPLSTRNIQDTDRFSMTVTSPSQYSGAVIEGRVIGERSGMVSGRATLSLSFETIRLRNGNTYRFGGLVEQVRDPNGDTISVNNEGTVRDDNQTTKTVTRAGIGAAIGAVIGAIAGGGKGAAIGAGVGAGAGVGTVILQGRDNIDLPAGTEFIIIATAPANVAVNR